MGFSTVFLREFFYMVYLPWVCILQFSFWFFYMVILHGSLQQWSVLEHIVPKIITGITLQKSVLRTYPKDFHKNPFAVIFPLEYTYYMGFLTWFSIHGFILQFSFWFFYMVISMGFSTVFLREFFYMVYLPWVYITVFLLVFLHGYLHGFFYCFPSWVFLHGISSMEIFYSVNAMGYSSLRIFLQRQCHGYSSLLDIKMVIYF
jgi:hypothetical protein